MVSHFLPFQMVHPGNWIFWIPTTLWIHKSWLQAAGGWSFGRLQIDPSIVALDANCHTSRVPLVKKDGYYVPDCDDVTNFPVPLIGGLEGTTVDWNEATSCEGDCHLIVHDVDTGMIWESYDTTVTVSNNVVTQITSTCVVL
jgi:hypothetical protein